MTQTSHTHLHGVTLEAMLTELVAHYGWEGLGQRIDIRCFKSDPSIKSSLTFLRKTEWRGWKPVRRHAARDEMRCFGK